MAYLKETPRKEEIGFA